MVKLKRITTFTNRSGKNRNQNNKDQVEKYNTINLNWMIKLKTNKIFTKELRPKN
jgi:hypothetical protein